MPGKLCSALPDPGAIPGISTNLSVRGSYKLFKGERTMKQEVKIFVHGGKAHADDMWACGVLVYALSDQYDFVEIIRDSARTDEAGPDDFVVDTGQKCDDRRLFDHHQFGRSDTAPCALTLVCRAYAPWLLEDQKYGKYFERIRVQDTKGVPAAEKAFLPKPGKKERVDGMSQCWSQMEWNEIKEFEEFPLETAQRLARMLKRRELEITVATDANTWLVAHSHREIVDDIVRCIVVDENPYPRFSVDALTDALNEAAEAYRAEVTYGWNPADPDFVQRSLYRTSYGKGIDFTRATPAIPGFCHNEGFLLVFTPETPEEFKNLIKQALI